LITCYALVNGRRTVYVPVTKRADASTLSVVNSVKANLPKFQSVVPGDVKVSYEFDQSPYVTRAIAGLTMEGALGALLTGLAQRIGCGPEHPAGVDGRGGRAMAHRPDRQHHDTRRPRAGHRHPGGHV